MIETNAIKSVDYKDWVKGDGKRRCYLKVYKVHSIASCAVSMDFTSYIFVYDNFHQGMCSPHKERILLGEEE